MGDIDQQKWGVNQQQLKSVIYRIHGVSFLMDIRGRYTYYNMSVCEDGVYQCISYPAISFGGKMMVHFVGISSPVFRGLSPRNHETMCLENPPDIFRDEGALLF